ncbi:MAG TPA: hypothetical protein VM717_01330, partial [Chthoniobacterales bacterium]|nr:hypothetical protein [Chthoniobacterales bacterium]
GEPQRPMRLRFAARGPTLGGPAHAAPCPPQEPAILLLTFVNVALALVRFRKFTTKSTKNTKNTKLVFFCRHDFLRALPVVRGSIFG